MEQQTAYLIRARRLVLASPISSGRSGHLRETGSFKIIEKERNHFSSLYGKPNAANAGVFSLRAATGTTILSAACTASIRAAGLD